MTASETLAALARAGAKFRLTLQIEHRGEIDDALRAAVAAHGDRLALQIALDAWLDADDGLPVDSPSDDVDAVAGLPGPLDGDDDPEGSNG